MAELDTIYNIVLRVCIVIVMFSSGVFSQPKLFVRYLSGQNLQLTLLAVASNVIVIPLMAIALICYVGFDPSIALLMYLFAISPAAPVLPFIVQINRGDLNLSLVLMFLLTLVSLITIPLMLQLGHIYLNQFFSVKPLGAGAIIIGYVLPVFVPLIAGMLIKILVSAWVERLSKILQRLLKIANWALLAVVLAINYKYLAAINSDVFTILLPFSLLCAVVAWSIVGPLRPSHEERVTVMIVGGLRNFAIILLLLNLLTTEQAIQLQVMVAAFVPILFGVATGWYGSRSIQRA